MSAASFAGYDRFAERYRDWWAPVIAPAGIRVLDRLAAMVPNGPFTVLDVGVGSGTVALDALERWDRARVVGVDPSTKLLAITAQHAQRRGASYARRLELLEGSGGALPLPNACVDIAASAFVIQLVPNRAQMLREVLRVLRPGGAFACVTWRADLSPSTAARLFDEVRIELGMRIPPPPPIGRPYRSTSVAAAEWRRAGFTEVSAATEWLELSETPQSFLARLEHWTEDALFENLEPALRDRLRVRLLDRLRGLAPNAIGWRRALVTVTGRRPSVGGASPATA